MRWERATPMTGSRNEERERWTDPDGVVHHVSVTTGKPLDLVALKAKVVADFRASVDEIRRSREAMYAGTLVDIVACPICDTSAEGAEPLFSVYGAAYVRCRQCEHVFVAHQPLPRDVADFYSSDATYSATYTDIERARLRVDQVALPKAAWTIERYARRFGRRPELIVDVGAGGGHFVRACQELGVEAAGFEVNEQSRAFCEQVFGFTLRREDITRSAAPLTSADVVTSWGVVEHVPEPLALLAAQTGLLGPDGMLVTAVPRWTSVSTAIQRSFPHSIVRHMDPGGHLHLFSDSSLLTAIARIGMSPTDAWYFGMDAYELVMQLGNLAEVDDLVSRAAPILNDLQATFDRAGLCDEVVVASVRRP